MTYSNAEKCFTKKYNGAIIKIETGFCILVTGLLLHFAKAGQYSLPMNNREDEFSESVKNRMGFYRKQRGVQS
ncbi:hypothetical protein D3C76_310820 [compost metagenome]